MADQNIGKVLAEKYRIDSLMHEEALGNLYSGTHLLMEKRVCLKILPPALAVDEIIVKNFANEARAVSRISHPNILNVTDYGSDTDKTFFIVYEDATGETLSETIERVGRFTLGRANHIVKEIAAALSAAHSNGIIHQNLTSDNVLIRRTPSDAEDVKVLNFGTLPFDINDLDFPVEKAKYLSPEQCSNTSEIDERTDIYSLGVILYEMLTGEVPFTADSTTDLMLKHVQETPPRLTLFRRDLPEQIDDILLKALAKNPDIRYQTANEFAHEFNQLALLHGETDEQITVVQQRANAATANSNATNNLWKTAFIVLAGVSLLGVFFIYMTQGKKTDPTTVQTDANGMPVQPVSPATGATEQGLANMDSFNPNMYSTANTGVLPDGGGAYNPYWDSGTRPPGAPPSTGGGGSTVWDNPYPVNSSVAPGGREVYVAPDGSIFMPNENGNSFIMVPKPTSNTATNTQSPKGKNANTNATVNISPPANNVVKPVANTATGNTATPEVKPSPSRTKLPVAPKATPKTEEKPKTEATPPATTEKRPQSGKQQDTL